MAAEEPPGRPTEFLINVPPEVEAGVYANFLGVWHTPYEFTLDFAAILPIQPPDHEDDSPLQVPMRVVSRVKIPVALIFDVLQALNENMTRYEERFGEIQRFDQ